MPSRNQAPSPAQHRKRARYSPLARNSRGRTRQPKRKETTRGEDHAYKRRIDDLKDRIDEKNAMVKRIQCECAKLRFELDETNDQFSKCSEQVALLQSTLSKRDNLIRNYEKHNQEAEHRFNMLIAENDNLRCRIAEERRLRIAKAQRHQIALQNYQADFATIMRDDASMSTRTTERNKSESEERNPSDRDDDENGDETAIMRLQ